SSPVVKSGRRTMADYSSKSGKKKKSVKDFIKSYKSKKSKMNGPSSDPPSEKKLKEGRTQPESSSDSHTSKTSSSSAGSLGKIDTSQLRRQKKPKRSRKEMEELIKDLKGPRNKIRKPFPPPSTDLPPTVPSQTSTVPVAAVGADEELPPPLIIPPTVSTLPTTTIDPPAPMPRSITKSGPADTVSPAYRNPSESPSPVSPTLSLSLLALGVVGIALFVYKKLH
ncbi:hypothetical protein PENTCL1PPCAC_6501, partial [Pristionchus entomophagus]